MITVDLPSIDVYGVTLSSELTFVNPFRRSIHHMEGLYW